MNVDFVVPWVDGNDPQWQKEFIHYRTADSSDDDNSVCRYRDWDILQYLFRSIEQFAPWVRMVHFVTNGQVPQWLNTNHPKLHLVNHKDFIPKHCLPTFSVRPIELNLHRIEGLSEQFVYFNDDYFFLAPVAEEMFFRDGLPCDMAVLNATAPLSPRAHVLINNGLVINRHFSYKEMLHSNRGKIITLRYGNHLLRTLSLIRYPYFLGFLRTHAPQPYLKSTFEDLWNCEKDMLLEVSSHKFRDTSDVNQELMRWWQLASGQFVPQNIKKDVKFRVLSDKWIDDAIDTIAGQRCKVIILNDDENDIINFDGMRLRLQAALNSIMPQKSSFEL